MGAIGRWIDEKCRAEPDVMRRVLNRKFGDLVGFVEEDGKCGCLVGSWALSRHALWPQLRHLAFLIGLGRANRLGVWMMGEEAFATGVAVYGMTREPQSMLRKRSDAFVVRLLKQRIRKSLGITLTETVAPEPVHADH